MEFSQMKRKKRVKNKNVDKLLTEIPTIGNQAIDKNEFSWLNTELDYTYAELLKRVIILDENSKFLVGSKLKFILPQPQILHIGAKKTSFTNFKDIANSMHRSQKHLFDFLLVEMGTTGSMNGNQQLIIKGRFQQKQIENVLRRYIKEYVICDICNSSDTMLQKDLRLNFFQCLSCGSRYTVAHIKTGFKAVIDKHTRAMIKAKTT